jgi:hypothetical protein
MTYTNREYNYCQSGRVFPVPRFRFPVQDLKVGRRRMLSISLQEKKYPKRETGNGEPLEPEILGSGASQNSVYVSAGFGKIHQG